jgi:hypothetical protein
LEGPKEDGVWFSPSDFSFSFAAGLYVMAFLLAVPAKECIDRRRFWSRRGEDNPGW